MIEPAGDGEEQRPSEKLSIQGWDFRFDLSMTTNSLSHWLIPRPAPAMVKTITSDEHNDSQRRANKHPFWPFLMHIEPPNLGTAIAGLEYP